MDQYLVELKMDIFYFDLCDLIKLIEEHGDSNLKEYLIELYNLKDINTEFLKEAY